MKKLFSLLLIVFLFVMSTNMVDALSIRYDNLVVIGDQVITDDGAGSHGSKSSGDKGVTISNEKMTCAEILGTNLTRLVKAAITIFQIGAAIFAIVKGMTILIPPITAKDAGALRKAGSKLVILFIVLAVAIPFGHLLEWDVSCVV